MASDLAAGPIQLVVEINADGSNFDVSIAAMRNDNVRLLQKALCKRYVMNLQQEYKIILSACSITMNRVRIVCTCSLDDNNVEDVVFSYEGSILQHDKSLGEQVPTHHLSGFNSVIRLQARLIKREQSVPALATDQSAGLGGSSLSSLALAADENGVQSAGADALSIQYAIADTTVGVQGLTGSTLGSLAPAEAACAASTSLAPVLPLPQPPACSTSVSAPVSKSQSTTRHLKRFYSDGDAGVFELCFMFSSPVAPTDLGDLDFAQEKAAITNSLTQARVPARFGAQVATASHIIATVTRATRRTIIHLAGHGEQAGFHAEKETGEGAIIARQTLVWGRGGLVDWWMRWMRWIGG